MDRIEMIDVLNGMCERCLIKGLMTTLDDAKMLYDVFNRFCNNDYVNDDEYSGDILYLYDLAVRLHEGGYTTLGESYSIYSAILHADNVEYVESNNRSELDVLETTVKLETVKHKRGKKSKVNDGIIDISDIQM